jgi:rRNA maturation endonuclease Nob1
MSALSLHGTVRHIWECTRCGRTYDDEPSRCECGHDGLVERTILKDE